MKVKDFLTHDKWIKGHCARDRYGKPCGTTDPEACHFDVLGAINVCYPENRCQIYDAIKAHLPANNKLLCLWNDGSTWEEIHAVLEKANV